MARAFPAAFVALANPLANDLPADVALSFSFSSASASLSVSFLLFLVLSLDF
jgi:hypothetical protein